MSKRVILKARCAEYQYGAIGEHTFQIVWNCSRPQYIYIWDKWFGGWTSTRGMSRGTTARLLRLARDKRAKLDSRNSARRAKRDGAN